MAKRILLFLSILQANSAERTYLCPNGAAVSGRQTNEAPVKYLMQLEPEITQILCVVSEAARSTAWEHFVTEISALYPDVRLTDIPFSGDEDITANVLPLILDHVSPGDEIYLDTTGGTRNNVMHMLLISRVLAYVGERTVTAVYANLGLSRIEEISHLYGLFDLVAGMQELVGFGSVRTLRAYYGRFPKDPRIAALLQSIEQLWETITLCRTGKIDRQMQAFDRALSEAEACSDPLMRELLPAFRRKFGEKMTTPALIRWCVESDMIQQALTIYNERIPAYILQERPDLLRCDRGRMREKLEESERYRSLETENLDAIIFNDPFLRLGSRMYKRARGKWCAAVLTLIYMDELMAGSREFATDVSADRLAAIAADYLYIRALRNMTNHANDEMFASQKNLMEYLESVGYRPLTEVRTQDIVRHILKALDRLEGKR